MIRVFIGYDRSETIAFHVLAHSILRHASRPVLIAGLVSSQLPLWRERDAHQSTDFAFSRFLVPHLCGYEGRAIFLDCDMLCRADIVELWESIGQDDALALVKHDYVPSTSKKFLGHVQTRYTRKNWSSMMVFNCGACRMLTPQYVNEAAGLELHQFVWMPELDIRALPQEWNHLVGEYAPNPGAKIAHFTLGTPCFERYARCEFADEWFQERRALLHHDRYGEFSRPPREHA